MFIYRLELILLEKVFFASREIDELFQTEPVLGNYALTYALGLAASPYRLSEREDRPYYREDLSALNAQGIEVTEVWTEPVTRQMRDERITCFLNPLDLSPDTEIGYYDFFNLPPVPLI